MRGASLTVLSVLVFQQNIIAQHIAEEDSRWQGDSVGIHRRIDSLFMHLDNSQITTGFLFERIAMPLSGMQFYNGHTDKIVDANQWLQMYFELRHFAATGPKEYPAIQDVISRIKTQNQRHSIPIGIISFAINKFKASALDSGLVLVQGGQLYNNPRSAQTPYEQKLVFAITSLGPIRANTPVTFSLDPVLCFSNLSDPITLCVVDLGDGAGFRSLHLGDAVRTSYSDTGTILIHLKAITRNDTLRCTARAFVGGDITSHSRLTSQATASCSDFMSNYDNQTYAPPDAIIDLVGGRGYVKYGCGNTAHALRKPFIFVEGIDFGSKAPGDNDGTRYGDVGWRQVTLATQWVKEDMFSSPQEIHDPNIENVPLLMNKLCKEGFDLIMLDFADGATGIDQNAQVLVRLLQNVNQQLKDNNSQQQIVVMGVSMGGQVSRYALRYMELHEAATGPHNTRMFISFDSPNRGANIALGTQFAMRFASFYFWTDELVGELFRPATKQLLIYHYNHSLDNNHAGAYPEHAALYGDPNMVSFPMKPRMVAISNGSGVNHTQGYESGEVTINVFTGRLFLVRAVGNYCCGLGGLGTDIFFGSYSTEATVVVEVVTWLANWLGDWFSNIVTYLVSTVYTTTTDLVTTDNTLPYDNTSGGWRNTNEFFVRKLPSASLMSWLHAESGRHNHSFIPTYSAMGVPLANMVGGNINQSMAALLNPTQPLNSTYPIFPNSKALTPFDVVYAPIENQQHVNVTIENIQWIMNEVSPSDLYVQNKTVTDNSPMLGTRFEASNRIFVGYNVDPLHQQAGYVETEGNGVTGATVSMRAGQSITVRDGTRFTRGSNVHLFIQPFPPCP